MDSFVRTSSVKKLSHHLTCAVELTGGICCKRSKASECGRWLWLLNPDGSSRASVHHPLLNNYNEFN